jgi:hypothetical protein
MIIGGEDFPDQSVKAFIGEQSLVIDRLNWQNHRLLQRVNEQEATIISLRAEIEVLRQMVQVGETPRKES